MSSNPKRIAQIKSKMDSARPEERQLGRAAEQVARNLFAMLKDAKAEGIDTKELVASALRREGDPAQKFLDRLTIPPVIDAQKLANRINRLEKKPVHYLEIAKYWADKMRRNHDSALLSLFDGTTYGIDREVTEDQYDPYALLASRLGDFARKVTRDAQLKSFWERLLKTPGRYDPRFERIVPNNQNIVVVGGGLKGSFICVDEMSPIASARLVRRLQRSPCRGQLWIDPNPESMDFLPSEEAGMPYLSPLGFGSNEIGATRLPILPASEDGSVVSEWDPAGFNCIEVKFLHWLDIRLAVGPQADNRSPIESDIGPLLEVRTMLEAEYGGEIVEFDNPFHGGRGIVRWAKRAGRWHRAVIKGSEEDEPLPMTNDWFDMPEHHYFSWAELSAASLEFVMKPRLFNVNDEKFQSDPSNPSMFVDPLAQEAQRRSESGLADDLLKQARGHDVMLRDHCVWLRERFERQVEQQMEKLTASALAATSQLNEEINP